MTIREIKQRLADLALAPAAYPAAWLMLLVRRIGVHRLPYCRKILMSVGVFPIRKHYYEPQFDFSPSEFSDDRNLPGIDWNEPEQLRMLNTLTRASELKEFPQKSADLRFRFDNPSFGPGDAEYWYQMVRKLKPKRVIEIGSGHSTLMALEAIRRNIAEDPKYTCEHICIEPYEMPWLERTGVSVVRKRVEELPSSYFSKLDAGDILFIDSSHVIRPQGDVLFEYLEILPTLKVGVVVHVHDIFSPKNYPNRWLAEEVRLWNEQYVLEAFLTHNRDWKIIGALNYLRHHHYDQLSAVAPFLTSDREPGSFYIQRVA
jgi:predicted O-methyltransferase YrrM